MLQAYYGPLSARDLRWLTRVLGQALLDEAWRFVFFHGSILSSGTENTDQALRAQLVPLFDRAKVHAVFYGYDHFYEHYEVTYGPWLFDPGHRPTGHRVHYFLTGGGGARLEHEYGLLDPKKMRRTTKQELVHAETGERRTFRFARRPWNPDRVNPQADPEWSRGGAAWYQDCAEEVYQDDAAFWGHRYGENVLHYLTLEVGEDEALVAVRYPDGSVLMKPSQSREQIFLFRIS